MAGLIRKETTVGYDSTRTTVEKELSTSTSSYDDEQETRAKVKDTSSTVKGSKA